MNQLKEMLEAYRNGERGLPTYPELDAVADEFENFEFLRFTLKRHQERVSLLEAQLVECCEISRKWASAAGDADGRAFKARNTALEAAAAICDGVNNHDNPMTAGDCADAIRALAAQEGE